MSIQDQARKQLAQQRQEDEHRQDAMLSRTEEELQTHDAESITDEEARERLAQQRLDEKQRQEAMLKRAEDEISSADS